MSVAGLSCTQATRQQDPAPSTVLVPPDSSLPASIATSIGFSGAFKPGTIKYDYRTSSVVRVTAGDSVSRIDSISVTALVSVVLTNQQPGEIVRGVINIDSIALQFGSTLPRLLRSQHDTVLIHIIPGRITRQLGFHSACSIDAEEAIISITDVFPSLPIQLKNSVWADTTQRETCRGGTHLQVYQIAHYQVDSASAAPRRLVRTTTGVFSGRGLQWNQAVEVSGQSSSVDTLLVDPTTERLSQLSGTIQLELDFRSKFRTQHFAQSTQRSFQVR